MPRISSSTVDEAYALGSPIRQQGLRHSGGSFNAGTVNPFTRAGGRRFYAPRTQQERPPCPRTGGPADPSFSQPLP